MAHADAAGQDCDGEICQVCGQCSRCAFRQESPHFFACECEPDAVHFECDECAAEQDEALAERQVLG